MEKTFSQFIEKYRPQIWSIIKSYLPRKPKKFALILQDYPIRQGKYLRPSLFLAALGAFGLKQKRYRLIAAALQTAEDWLLIHDDVEDSADFRRHRPALNQLYGEALAINAGDSLHLLMWKMLIDNQKLIGYESGLKIAQKFYQVLFKTTEGQFEELYWIHSNKTLININDYLRMVAAKTAAYTTTGPIHLAAILAGQDSKLKLIEKFSIPWAQAFQIQNDIRNLRLIEESNTNDILEGKRTIPLIYTLLSCSEKDAQEIKKIYLKPRNEKTPEEINRVLKMILAHGGIEHAQFIADKLRRKAINALTKSRHIFVNQSQVDVLESALIETTNGNPDT